MLALSLEKLSQNRTNLSILAEFLCFSIFLEVFEDPVDALVSDPLEVVQRVRNHVCLGPSSG
jgi:hypothetical protein